MAIEADALQERTFLQRLRSWLILGNGVIAAVLLGLVVQWQADILHSEQEDERSRVQGLALSISQTLAGQMDQVDLGLQSVTQHLRAMDKGFTTLHAEQVNAMLAAQRSVMPFLDGLVVTDAQGRVRYGDDLASVPTMDLGAQAHFQQARAQRQPALILSGAVASQAPHEQRLYAVRRLAHADGSFAGIVSATLHTGHFQQLFSAVKLGAAGAVSLRNEARQILALVFSGQSQDQWYGTTETSPELARAFDSHAASGSFLSTVKQDGVERISAFQRVGNYPLIVLVGEGTSSFLAPWRAQVERIALLCTLAALIMVALSVVVYFAIRRETSGRSQVQAELRRLQAWMQASQDGVHVLNRNGTIVGASAALAALLGYHPDYLQGRHLALLTALPLPELLPPDTPGAVRKLQTKYRRQDGSLCDVELYVSTIPLPTGHLLYCSARDISHLVNTAQGEA